MICPSFETWFGFSRNLMSWAHPQATKALGHCPCCVWTANQALGCHMGCTIHTENCGKAGVALLPANVPEKFVSFTPHVPWIWRIHQNGPCWAQLSHLRYLGITRRTRCCQDTLLESLTNNSPDQQFSLVPFLAQSFSPFPRIGHSRTPCNGITPHLKPHAHCKEYRGWISFPGANDIIRWSSCTEFRW